jgi:monoamine oxidase
MGKTTGFDQVTRAMRLGKLCADRGITAAEGLERAAEARLRHERAGGEHTDSFYEWQGYMEGALNSGIRAANELIAEI